jgi:ankyrin repeat protein
MKASRNGHTTTVQILLEAGADKDAKDRVKEHERGS